MRSVCQVMVMYCLWCILVKVSERHSDLNLKWETKFCMRNRTKLVRGWVMTGSMGKEIAFMSTQKSK